MKTSLMQSLSLSLALALSRESLSIASPAPPSPPSPPSPALPSPLPSPAPDQPSEISSIYFAEDEAFHEWRAFSLEPSLEMIAPLLASKLKLDLKARDVQLELGVDAHARAGSSVHLVAAWCDCSGNCAQMNEIIIDEGKKANFGVNANTIFYRGGHKDCHITLYDLDKQEVKPGSHQYRIVFTGLVTASEIFPVPSGGLFPTFARSAGYFCD